MQTTLHQPKPRQPYASFLKDFVDPDPCPRVEPIHQSIFTWLQCCEPNRWNCSRSDSYLHNDATLRDLTRSAPELGHRQLDGFVVPPTPISTRFSSHGVDIDAESVAPSASTSSGRRSLVEDPLYRSRHLAVNGIHLGSSREQPPEHISNLIDYVRKDRQSPGPSLDEIQQDTALEELSMGAGEPKVQKYFQANIFPNPVPEDVLDCADRQPMLRHVTPTQGPKLKVNTPVPDMLYGYRNAAFPQQQPQLISMGNEMLANNQGLMYPFFAIEFKGDGPGGTGSLWVATNQCLGASASCVLLAERLNRQLRDCKSDEVTAIDSAAFSIAMNGTEARLYISWKSTELEYRMRQIGGFLLQDPEHYLNFRKQVRNIIDWGKEKRLQDIQRSLASLLEESRKRLLGLRSPAHHPLMIVRKLVVAREAKEAADQAVNRDMTAELMSLISDGD